MGKSRAKGHLVVVKRKLVEAILKGHKTIECRLLANRRVPFGHVERGDHLFFKISCGPVCATARVEDVKNFEGLTARKIRMLRKKYNDKILAGEQYWREKNRAKYGVLVWLTSISEMTARRIRKRDRSAWVVLSPDRSYGLVR